MSDKVEVAEVAPLQMQINIKPISKFHKGAWLSEWQPIDTKKKLVKFLDLGFTPLLVPMLGYISGKELHSN